MAPRPRIPFTVLGGFLGAGKTTLVNRLLQAGGRQRVAVLVNDFGAINVDAALVASRGVNTIALSNGCMCCQIGDDLSGALIGVLEAEPPFEAIVVEASGVSDPWRIAQIALAEPALALEAVVVLVDASSAFEQARDPLLGDTLARQLRAADVVLVNKIDLADAAGRAELRAWIGRTARTEAVFETVQAEAPMPLLVGGRSLPAEPAAWAPRSMRDAFAGHAAAFESWSAQPAGVFPAEALRALVKAMPSGVLRLKGLLRTDAHGWSELQFAGRHGALRKALSAPADGLGGVVAIGLRGRLPVAALEAAFAAAG